MWTEDTSKAFIEYGRYYVPEREFQISTMVDLIPPRNENFHVLELACGEGRLAKAIMDQFPQAVAHGYDGSETMLRHAKERLASYGNRFDTAYFDLAAAEWRQPPWSLHAVVSALAIHHLDGPQKQQLYLDVFKMLDHGGVFLIADISLPASKWGQRLAAKTWDNIVRQQAIELDGNETGFQHFRQQEWNLYRYPDPVDKPSGIYEQLRWLDQSGFSEVDLYWMRGGHAIFGGRKSARD
jgi:tRNA (cmo5U34)-methyltransferase